ncbi:MAG: UDP-N-acetylmuramoyl-tripeptide--D-alanyl-D-alanine ligase [Muribaculaceae bacterium]|nr:UDP-N-acetylmuramoyl-tripeptide--D-alanyl-D-alanine ligase [Muribaculaceae bacterium]
MTPHDIQLITGLTLLIITLAYMIPVYRRDLMMLQQNSYRNERYARWFTTSNESTTFPRILGCIALFLILIYKIPFRVCAIPAAIIIVGCMISLLRRRYKKPLVMTARARRIFITMLAISYLLAAGTWLLTYSLQYLCAMVLLEVVASPFILLGANLLLRPVEARINRKYYNEARDILASIPDLRIIGITGSYGKTSTKHYLHAILSSHFDTLMTPGSYNTTLGVIRTIREYLQPYNEIFIVEMGAKQLGDIREICDLVHPSIGIVTAVGEQHLESFKSIENVQRTKFELVDSLPSDGLAVINDDFPMIASRQVDNVPVIRYTARPDDLTAQYRATDIAYTPAGTTFTIVGPDDFSIDLTTRLLGECNISNLTAAVAVAVYLGVPADKIRYAVENIEPVEHRLSIRRTAGGLTIIDDAFNSNPHGSRMAMEVLSQFTGGRRIVITPGMIELGQRQAELNRDLGGHISRSADIAIIVGEYNREALTAGIASDGTMPRENVHTVDTFTQAQQLLMSFAAAGDTVIYENDLPDTFK